MALPPSLAAAPSPPQLATIVAGCIAAATTPTAATGCTAAATTQAAAGYIAAITTPIVVATPPPLSPLATTSIVAVSSNISRRRHRFTIMAGPGRSMLYSFLLFTIILSLLEMYRGKLASSELLTIAGGFISSLIFLVVLTFIGNYQESCGIKTGWGAVVLAESVALVAASTVHRVCITTCFLFSAGFLYEINKLSGMMLAKSESRVKRY